MARSRCDIRAKSLEFTQRDIREQFVVAEHQLVGNLHRFAELFVRRFIDADVIAEGLAHFLYAVETFQERRREHDLLLLSVFFLEIAAHQQVEFLIATSQFHVRFESYRVVALHDRIQQFVYRNGQLILHPV